MKKLIYFIKNITLKEISIAGLIAITVAAITVPLILKHNIREKSNQAMMQISLLEQAVICFRNDTGKRPVTLEDLLTNDKNFANWKGPYIKEEATTDPWGRKFIFNPHKDDPDYDIICYGKDGIPDGLKEDVDISNRP